MTISTEELTAYMLIEFPETEEASGASGECYSVTESLMKSYLGYLSPIYAEHNNSPTFRFLDLGQYSNHWACVQEDGSVVDYTLRQFNPDTPWPWVGSVQEWTGILSDAWEDPNTLVVKEADLCFSCYHITEISCKCRCKCGLNPNYCNNWKDYYYARRLRNHSLLQRLPR